MPIRILHIVSFMQRGGLETLIMNCYRNIDRKKMQFDFIVHRDFRADYDDEIESLGGRIYRLPRLNPFSPKYKNALLNFFREHCEYRIVHCHLDCMSALPLAAAKQCGVPVRIAHAHCSNQAKNWKYPLKRICMQGIPNVATHFFACSEDAGQWMFPGQNVTIINNGIETDQFAYNPQVRNKIREELGLKQELTLGHVGRFMPEKNHMFLLDIFAEVCKCKTDAKLLLVGTGPYLEQVREKAEVLNLASNVLFLGVRKDVNRILQAMDVFVLPSLYEGLGIVAVEAQATGLPCIISDGVSKECIRTKGLVSIQSLCVTAAQWAEHILARIGELRMDHSAEVKQNGFDVEQTAAWLEDFYINVGEA